ncbi:helicase-associated domain-containing protein [Microbacterium sp. HMH0099]|uniref:helicase-associated domain-containing protein n=1 Tax=Microbacterium sp. HMH0099 TaxID=3414026 RepID=UPI003BF6B742
MSETSDQRALAVSLGAMRDDELVRLFADREVSPTATWRDMFDAADALLDPASIGRALPALNRAEAQGLVDATASRTPLPPESRDALISRALAREDGTPFTAVAEIVGETFPDGIPDTEIPAVTSDPAPREAAAAEDAFTNAASLADVLLLALETPLGRIGSGSLGAGERRRLVETGAAVTPDDADLLVGLGAAVGLLGSNGRAWLVTRAGRDWLRKPTLDRWESTAAALRDALPSSYRSPDGGWVSAYLWAGAAPFDPTGPRHASEWIARFRAWGLIDTAGQETPWSRGLAAGGPAETDALRALLPPEVDRVYLQNDLTAIAPGPLAPHLDVRLRGMAARESRAQASSYRFSAASIGSAITAGETAESLRDFLTGLSLTGLPQPLAYVIERSAAEHGRVRVARDEASGLTRIRTDDATLARAMEVDQSLRSIALTVDDDADGHDLVTHVDRDVVFWALSDAHYPAVAVDADGRARALDRARLAPDESAPSPADVYAPLVGRLRAGVGDSDAAWLERELDQAVRTRSVVDVTVRLPDGSARVFRLEATGLGGGRLRGRDKAADVERTLPLSHIDGVALVD